MSCTKVSIKQVTTPATTKGDLLVHDGTNLVRLPAGTNGQVLNADSAAASGLAFVTLTSGGLTNFTESVNTAAPNATVPVVRLLATNAATDVDVALSPKGSGAITAQVADNTTTGGNKRGASAVDLQMIREAATQVASGNSSVTLGYGNTASGAQSAVGGGNRNTASNSYASVSGGILSSASGYASSSSGYINAASGDYSSIGGGQSNTASGINATVGGGVSNTASGTSATVGGGDSNTASGYYSSANNRTTTSTGFAQTTHGQFNVLIPSTAATAYSSTAPVLILGNGTGTGARSNALLVTFDGRVSIGANGVSATTPTTNLDINGGMSVGVNAKTAAYTITGTDYVILCDATATGAFTVTLPTAANKGQILVIKKVDSTAGAITIGRAGTDTIEGATTKSLAAQYNSYTLVANGTSTWYITAST